MNIKRASFKPTRNTKAKWLLIFGLLTSFQDNNTVGFVAAVISTTKTPVIPLNLSGCDTNWYRFQESCYQVITEEHYFKDAVRTCQSKKSSLVTIYSKAENLFVSSLVKHSSTYGEVWIGLSLDSNKPIVEIQQSSQNNNIGGEGSNTKGDVTTKTSTGLNFVWIDGLSVGYEKWMLNRPAPRAGNCVQMITGGHWNNVNCYNRFSLICKKDKNVPVGEDNLRLILNITIPLSCVFIMICFVAFLCFKSHTELQEIKDENLDGKPFELIQAAMILPIKKAPDLLNPNGKNLWKSAIERLKQEQIRNNPLSEPSTFVSKGSLRSIVDEVANRNKNISSSSNPNNFLRERNTLAPSKTGGGGPAADSSFAELVNNLMLKRRNTTFSGGTLGLPFVASNPHVPKIEVDSPEHKLIAKQNEEDTDSSSSSGSSPREAKDDEVDLHDFSKTTFDTPNHHNETNPFSSMTNEKSTLRRENDYITEKDEEEDGSASPVVANRRTMKVVVDLNNFKNKHNNNKDRKSLIGNDIGDTKHIKDSNNTRKGTNFREHRPANDMTNINGIASTQRKPNCLDNNHNDISAGSEEDEIVLERNRFRDSLRSEAQKRKDIYFPSISPDKKIAPSSADLTRAIPYKPRAADYTTVTLV